MINDIDNRAQARIGDLRKVIQDAEKVINISITAAEQAADKELKRASDIVDKAKADIDEIIKEIDAEIEKVDCIKDKTVDEIRKLITIDWSLLHFDTCYTSKGYRFTSPDYYDDVDRYRIRQCQLEGDLQNSSSVKEILDKLSQLSALSQRTSCILRLTTGAILADDDFERYGNAFATWYLTTKH